MGDLSIALMMTSCHQLDNIINTPSNYLLVIQIYKPNKINNVLTETSHKNNRKGLTKTRKGNVNE